jgi:steroid delta-isomerase-like uncharacterized protein
MTRQDIEALFARREQLMNQHDALASSDFYTEDAVVESPTAGGAVTGRAAIEAINRAWMAGFPDVVFSTKAVVVDGDRVVWVVDAQGTDSGGFMGLPATDKSFRAPMALICTLRDGLISHERRIYDFTGLLIQIGVLRAKPT